MTNPQDIKSKIGAMPLPSESAGDLGAHYRQAYPKLVAIAAGVLGSREDAEDVVQQAAGIAVEKAQPFESPAALVRWLAGIVRNCALNHRRKKFGRRTYAADPRELALIQQDRASRADVLSIQSPTGDLPPLQSAFDDDVLRALGSLGEEARCCLLLRVVQQLSYAEIAELMSIPAGTAMSHVHRSKQALRSRLAQHDAARHFTSTSPT